MHLNAAIKEDLSSPIARLRAKAGEFNVTYNRLLSQEPDRQKDPALYKKWLSLKNTGETTRSSIGRILGIADWVGNAAGAVWDYVSSPFSGSVSVLPLIPLAITGAIITSAMASMTYFISNAYEYGKLADATPEVRAALLKKDASGFSGILSGVTGLIAVAGIVYFLPKIFKGK